MSEQSLKEIHDYWDWWKSLSTKEQADRLSAMHSNMSVLVLLKEEQPHLFPCPGCRQPVLTNGDGTYAICPYCGDDIEMVNGERVITGGE